MLFLLILTNKLRFTFHLLMISLFINANLTLSNETVVSSGISYSGGLHDYDIAGSEMGFHLVTNNNGSIKHYLLGNDGAPISGYEKTFVSSGAIRASVTTLNGNVFVCYRLDNQLKIWKSSEGGKSNSWSEKTAQNLANTSLTSRISSSGYGFYIHVAWDNGNEIYYNRFDINDDEWDLTNNILAESNYWGASSPDSAWFYGLVDRSPCQSSSLGAGPSWKQTADAYWDAIAAYDEEDYKEALSLFESLLDTQPEHERIGSIAFLFGKSALKVGVLETKLSVLQDFVRKQANAEVAHVERVWSSYQFASIADMEKARSVCLSAPEASLSERELLLSLIGYYVSNDDMKGAEEIAALLRTKRKEDAELESDIEASLNSPKLTFKSTSLPKVSLGAASMNPDWKIGAYPNPFNPSTTVQFQATREEFISVRIFDVRGRRVASLVEARLPPGLHSLVWDGRNSSGRPAAAGVYFAALRTNRDFEAIKLLLVK